MRARILNPEGRKEIFDAARVSLANAAKESDVPLNFLRSTGLQILSTLRASLANDANSDPALLSEMDTIFVEALLSVWIEFGGQIRDIPSEFLGTRKLVE